MNFHCRITILHSRQSSSHAGHKKIAGMAVERKAATAEKESEDSGKI